MSQYAHFPVKGDTFWQIYRNACFQWIKWWDFPVMTCAECGVRIIPSIPAMILYDWPLFSSIGYCIFRSCISG